MKEGKTQFNLNNSENTTEVLNTDIQSNFPSGHLCVTIQLNASF